MIFVVVVVSTLSFNRFIIETNEERAERRRRPTDGKINSLKRPIIIDIKRRRVDPPSRCWEKSTSNKKKIYQATEKIKDDEEEERTRRGEE